MSSPLDIYRTPGINDAMITRRSRVHSDTTLVIMSLNLVIERQIKFILSIVQTLMFLHHISIHLKVIVKYPLQLSMIMIISSVVL